MDINAIEKRLLEKYQCLYPEVIGFITLGGKILKVPEDRHSELLKEIGKKIDYLKMGAIRLHATDDKLCVDIRKKPNTSQQKILRSINNRTIIFYDMSKMDRGSEVHQSSSGNGATKMKFLHDLRNFYKL